MLIVCEGKTEEEYFRHLRNTERIPIRLEIKWGVSPISLVRWAVDLKTTAEEEARKDANARYEEIWCIYDVDDHQHMAEAAALATTHSIRLGISNPCIELWLLLHFQEQNAHLHRDKALTLCKKHMPSYDKHPPCDKLHPLCSDAIKRAKKLDSWQTARNKPGANPSTQVYRLVESIRSHRT